MCFAVHLKLAVANVKPVLHFRELSGERGLGGTPCRALKGSSTETTSGASSVRKG